MLLKLCEASHGDLNELYSLSLMTEVVFLKFCRTSDSDIADNSLG